MCSPRTAFRTCLAIASISLAVTPCTAATLGTTTPGTFVYAEASSPSTPVYRQFVDPSWTSQAPANSVSSAAEWQVVRNCPTRDEMALLSLCSDKGLRLQLRDTGWGSTSTLATDCGTSNTRTFDAAYEAASGELLVAYRKTTSTSIFYRSFATPSPSEQTYAAGFNDEPRWVGLTPVSGSDQIVLLVATDTRLYGAVWNGTSFGSLTTLETSLPQGGFPRAAASPGAGSAIVAWGSTAVTSARYATWNGTTWSSIADAPAASGVVYGVVLAPNPSSSGSDVLMACVDAANDISVSRWSGSAWGSATVVETNAGSFTQQRVGLAYCPSGATALLAWHRAGQTALRSRTWDGTTWSSTATGTDMGNETTALLAEAGPAAGEVSLAVRYRNAGTTLGDYSAYAQTGTATVNGTASGLVDDQVTGVVLPPAPTNAAGATDVTYGNNATATLAPGARKKLTASNGLTMNLTSGTYVFTDATMGNGATWNVDTSLGDTSIILTNGNLTANNSFRITTTGSGQVIVHVVNGNFDVRNTTSLRASVVVYNGNLLTGSSPTVHGTLLASGNVTTGSGAVLTHADQPFTPSNARLMLLRFSAGSMGGATLCSSSVAGWANRSNFSLMPVSGDTSVRVTRWRESTSDE
ncbi:MAG TPA: hypothetical protein VHN77_06770 [Phycisphaerales bacterium]|nr:hypothetical protein [Phycisphaerales bacterium]